MQEAKGGEDGLLRQLMLPGVLPEANTVSGILNGIDDRVWNPLHDPHLPVNYGSDSLELRAGNKAALQAELGLEVRPELPLFTVVSRLTEQKGLPRLPGVVVEEHIALQAPAGLPPEIIRRAKNDGVRVTCEVSPHHLLLNESDIVDYDTHYKMNPPLRTAADREALLAGERGELGGRASDRLHAQLGEPCTQVAVVREDRAGGAVEQPPKIDSKLLCLWTRQQCAKRKSMEKSLLAYPTPLLN